jgi:hypothetical protein
MRTDDVEVQPTTSQGAQTHRRTRPALDIPESSHIRRTDEEDDDNDDPTYGQDELTGSQLADTPEATQTQVCVLLPTRSSKIA